MEKREKVVDDRVYSMLVPPVRPAMRLCTRVSVLVGPVLGSLVPMVKSLGTDVKDAGWDKFRLSLDDFGPALDKVDPDKVDGLFMEAVTISKLSCGGNTLCTEADFERHFIAHREDVYPVSIWCLWECVRDFFPKSGAFAQTVQDKVVQAVMVSRSLQDGK